MCRFAVYNGPPRRLSSLTHEPEHSLLVQSHSPREMREASLNADGVGAAWYPDDGDPKPCRYRSAGPMWSDENLAQLAPRIRSSMLLTIVRSATPGLPIGPASTPPYVHGPIAFMHNGYLEGFRKNFMRPVRELLSDAGHDIVLGGTDTEHIFGLLLDSLGQTEMPSIDALANAVHETVRTCTKLAERVGARACLNLAVSNGKGFVATQYVSSGNAGTLYSAVGARGFEEGVVVASEPLTKDVAWRAIPADTMVVVENGRMRTSLLR